MKLYRFSPIKSKEGLLEAIRHIHFECHKLCKESLGRYLPNAGNVGVFCHYQEEYEYLTKVREGLTNPSESFNQKYFTLYEPIVIEAKGDIPETAYKYLYVRKPDPYRHHVGDIDFFLEDTKYRQLKERVANKEIKDARVFPSPHLDMVELHHPDNDTLAYVSNEMMVDLVKNTYSNS